MFTRKQTANKYISNKVNPLTNERTAAASANVEIDPNELILEEADIIIYKYNEKRELRIKLQKQIDKVNAATTISERMLSYIKLYTTINRNIKIIKDEITEFAQVILEKSNSIIDEIQNFIENEPDLLEEDKSIMSKTIALVKDTASKLVQ